MFVNKESIDRGNLVRLCRSQAVGTMHVRRPPKAEDDLELTNQRTAALSDSLREGDMLCLRGKLDTGNRRPSHRRLHLLGVTQHLADIIAYRHV